MEKYRNLNNAEEKELRSVFKKSVRLSKAVFGDKAFKRFVVGSGKDHNGYWETRKINKGLFDVIMFGFTMYDENQIVPNADLIREELLWFMTHDLDFIDTITVTTDRKDKVHTRFDKWLSALKVIVGTPKTETRTFSLEYKKQLWDSIPTCAICGQKIHLVDDAEVDHVEQYWQGGKTIPTTARLTHRYCNRARRFPGDMRQKPIGLIGSHLSSKGNKITRICGAKPRKEYRIPILEVLIEKGGKATQSEVFEIIEQKMGKDFNQLDLETLSDGYTKRWQKMVAWQRYIMVKNNLLMSDSSRGVWEITEKGKNSWKITNDKKRPTAYNTV